MNIPDTYAANETLSSAYRNGWNHGHGIACHNVPEIGAKLFVEDMGRVTVDANNIREVHQSFCFSAESNSRQYSPFEFLAHDLKSLDDETDEEQTPQDKMLVETVPWHGRACGSPVGAPARAPATVPRSVSETTVFVPS